MISPVRIISILGHDVIYTRNSLYTNMQQTGQAYVTLCRLSKMLSLEKVFIKDLEHVPTHNVVRKGS